MRPLGDFPLAARRAVRAVFFDIDDTLTTQGRLTADAYAAVERLHRAALTVVPITGRPAGWCDHIARMWPVSAVVGENGRIVLKATKSVTLEEGSRTTANGPSGGSVSVESEDTTLVAGVVEARGEAGAGGTVHLLGDRVGLIGRATADGLVTHQLSRRAGRSAVAYACAWIGRSVWAGIFRGSYLYPQTNLQG